MVQKNSQKPENKKSNSLSFINWCCSTSTDKPDMIYLFTLSVPHTNIQGNYTRAAFHLALDYIGYFRKLVCFTYTIDTSGAKDECR